jgi:hypothetical protein
MHSLRSRGVPLVAMVLSGMSLLWDSHDALAVETLNARRAAARTTRMRTTQRLGPSGSANFIRLHVFCVLPPIS